KMQLRPLRDAMSRLFLDVPTVIGRGILDRATQLAQLERFQFDGTVVRELAQKRSMLEVTVAVRVQTGLAALSVGIVEFVREGAMSTEEATDETPVDEAPVHEASMGETPSASPGAGAAGRPVGRVEATGTAATD